MKRSIVGSSRLLDSEFLALSDKFATFSNIAGKPCVPYRCENLLIFSSLSSDRKRVVLEALRIRLELIRTLVQSGGDISSSKQILWYMLKISRLHPSSDLMEHLTDDCVVEVHWLHDLSQMFHSFSFYDYSSYTLEELASISWQDLYETDLFTQQKIFELAERIKRGEIKSTINPGLDSYVVKELNSIFQFEVSIKYKFVSPVFDKLGHPVAAVSIEDMNILKRKELSREEEERALIQKIGLFPVDGAV